MKKQPGTVFLVHARNEKLRSAMFVLRSMGLKAREWDQAVSFTDNNSPYIKEVLDAAFDNAQVVVSV